MSQPTVFVVEDDAALRAGLSGLFRSVDLPCETYPTATDFLNGLPLDRPGCVVMDIRLPGMSGLDVQARLAELGVRLPVVMMTGYADVPMTVRAMKAGAVDFLPKPFRDQDMLDAVANALARDASAREADAAASSLRNAYESLTTREREVMAHVTAGLLNKQVAGLLKLSEITVKVHRGNVMRKMQARSLADLVLMARALSITSAIGKHG
ncbi:response regulator transcription factor [Salinarimonas soli]|uniref:Response regulator transcription factor n=1 Tax=Salinarimonas soli TaxID=1638099 RepID=A0A5B2VCU6_9HYPH|nr:response regulator [Salinarimonas soli]KAA2236565.1 response regulator transcription factor [Salinarimonas soli]